MAAKDKNEKETRVGRSPEAICADIEQTRSALTQKLDLLEHRVSDKIQTVRSNVDGAVQKARRAFDLPHQVRMHPWPMFGASVATGLVLGRLLDREPGSRMQRIAAVPSASEDDDVGRRKPRRSEGLFAEELRYLRTTAIGAVMALVRDALTKSFPTMTPRTERVIDGLTRKLGGEPVTPALHSPPE